MVDWNQFVPGSALPQMQAGSDYVTRLYDLQANKAAGAKVVSGDLRGAAGDLAGRGDVSGALNLTDRAAAGDRATAAQAQSDADRKAAQFKTQHEYLQRAVPVLTQILQKAGPQKLLEAYGQLSQELQQMGIPPEAIEQYGQAFQRDPQGTLQTLAATAQRKFQFQKVGDDVIVLDEADPSKPVAEFRATPKPPPGPTPADLARDANNPFRSDGTPNEAFQRYETDKARTLAQDRRDVIVNNPLPSQTVTGGGLTRQQAGVARQKLNSLGPIENQINRVEQAMEGAEKGGYTGYVAGNVPGGLDAKSDVFDKSVATLATLVRQLTRVPGEGAMSDYESRLAALTLPSRTDTPEGRRESLEGMRQLIREIRAGYSEMLGQVPAGTAPAAPHASSAPGNIIDFNSLPD